MTGTLIRLAFAGARSRRLSALLTVALTAAVAAAIVMATTVRGAVDDPWQQTFDTANGAHVIFDTTTKEAAEAIAGLPDVVEHNAPIPYVPVQLAVNGNVYQLFVYGLDGTPTVNTPIQTSGSALQAGGITLERSFADELNFDPGDVVTLESLDASIDLTVDGTAIVPSQPRYPRANPGIAWISRSDLATLAPDMNSWRWELGVRVADPLATEHLIQSTMGLSSPGFGMGAMMGVMTWQQQRQNQTDETQPFVILLGFFALLLLVVSVAVIVTLASARVASQEREFGLLGALGLTPWQIGALSLIEQVVLAIAGLAIGFAAGTLLMPLLIEESLVSLMGTAETTFGWSGLIVAALVILPVVAIASGVSVARAVRVSVVRRLVTVNHRPHGPIAALARRLPVVLSVSMGDLLARRKSALTLAVSFLVSATAIVTSLMVRARLGLESEAGVSDVPDAFPRMMLTLNVVLGLIVISLLLSTVLLGLRERRREFSVLRTIGGTPREIVTAIASSYALVALLASILGVPAGMALFSILLKATDGETDTPFAKPWLLLGATPLVVALLAWAVTGAIARSVNQAPVADLLRTE